MENVGRSVEVCGVEVDSITAWMTIGGVGGVLKPTIAGA